MGRHKGSYADDKYLLRYSVWDNKTDRLVACDEVARKCAELMRIKTDSFHHYHYLNKVGRRCRWTIEICEPLEDSDL